MMTHQDVIVDPAVHSSRSNRSCLPSLVAIFSILVSRHPPACRSAPALAADAGSVDVHQQLLELAARQERSAAPVRGRQIEGRSGRSSKRRCGKRFSVCSTVYPMRQGAPPVRKTGTIEADDYVVEKLVFESFPGYFVPALLYKPKKLASPVPGVLSPCGHSTIGKAAGDVPDPAHQPGQARLCRLDVRPGRPGRAQPVLGRGERPLALQSELWRACGPGQPALPAGHQPGAVPDLGRHARTGLPDARCRKWMRRGSAASATREAARSRPTLRRSTARDRPRRFAATSRRSGAGWATASRKTRPPIPSRTSSDSSASGSTTRVCSALRAPRPTLLGAARLDFFPIEGTRESFAEAKRLYEIAGAGDRIECVEAPNDTA